MMTRRSEDEAAPGYLLNVEASHISIRSGPAVLYVTLARQFASEQASGHPVRKMFMEMPVSEAFCLYRMLGEAIAAAGALARQPPHADAAGNL